MFTKYSDINQLLSEFKTGILSILGEDVLGIYLFGSLTYGDFEPSRSDIDLSIITKQFLTNKQISDVRNLHQDIEKMYPRWKGRLECSYTPKEMFISKTPPGDRPYWGESKLYIGTYGNEWIINNYLLQEYSIILYGIAFNTFCPTISISQVKSACLSDLQKEWAPKLNDDLWLSDSHYQSYLVLNLCRILHTVKNNKASSKKVSAIWVKNNFPKWTLLIDKALSWHYGEIMKQANTTKEFLAFILKETLDSTNIPRIFLIHGWGGSPQSDWFPWAIEEFSKLDYEVIAPLMPDSETPVIRAWVDHLSAQVGKIRESDVFIGHSIGCQTILRYLEQSNGVVAKVILAAPWFTLTNLENDDAWKVAEPWIKTTMDFSKIRNKAEKFITIFSDNDPWVPYLENISMFEEKLNPEVVVLHNKGHITAEEGSQELTELLELL